MARFERHQKATDRLSDELNFVKLIRNLRVSEFISRLLLKRSQRVLVQNFRKYSVDGIAEDEPIFGNPVFDTFLLEQNSKTKRSSQLM